MYKIRELREAKGMTQQQLGEIAGVRQDVISDYENGRTSPPVNRLVRMADALGVSVDELLGRNTA